MKSITIKVDMGDLLFGKKKEKTIRDVAVSSLTDMIADYSEWYDGRGIHLPKDFATDPTGWGEAMHKMRDAFQLIRDGEVTEENEKDVVEGLTLFGQNLLYMTDPKIGTDGGHTKD